MPNCLLPLVLGLVLASPAWAFDSWPQWRGPNRDAVSNDKNLRDRWETAPPLVWRAQGLGDGCAGAVVDGGVVCTMGDRNGKAAVIALRDKDGKKIWTAEIGDVERPGSNWESKCTPTIDGDRLYAVSSKGDLVCLKTTTGERIWGKSYKQEFDGVTTEFGYAESPLVDGDKLIFSPGGPKAGIVALDKKTGKELWRCALSFDKGGRKGASYSSVVVSRGAGVKQYVQWMTPGLTGIDAQTGKQLWSYSRLGTHNNPCTPIVRGDYVFAPCGYYIGSSLLKLVPMSDGGVEAKEVYFLNTGTLQMHSGGAVLVGDYIYGSHVHPGCPQCIEFLTGRLLWERGRGPGSGPAAVIYADGHLYFHYENGIIALVAATPDKYELKGKFRTPDRNTRCWAHPALSNGRLYLREHDAIYCYDLKK